MLFCVALVILWSFFPGTFSGPISREAWVSSRLRGSPEPPSPYVTERVFTNLAFVEPLELVSMPGRNRLFLAEHAGRIFSFSGSNGVGPADLFVDMKKLHPDTTEVYSLAFDPDFAANRYVYIWYILKPELPDGTHISRFRLTQLDPPQLDAASERVIITWKSGGHNGGCIRFGRDGMLYIGTGDGVGPVPPDDLNTGQDNSDLLSSILRIDVRGEENGRAYRIPPDNPFVNTPGCRPEIWAYGFRNPWRMSIDSRTGDLWAGDVGWELWEMIYRVVRGGNYGWSIIEGSHQPVKPNNPRGPTPILPPTVEHPHSEAASITGGIVYWGTRLESLRGSYIYGDYETGRIWELRHDGTNVVKHREIAQTRHKIATFGEGHDGELYVVDFGGTIHRLIPNPLPDTSAAFPRKLSQTGLFDSIREGREAEGVLPYGITAEMWSDHATAERLVGIPGQGVIRTRDERWQFPSNSVLAKTYSMELEVGNPASKRRLETQVLHFDGERWNPYSYRWNEDQTEAELVPASGTETVLTVTDPDAPVRKRTQRWRFHSRSECLRCHNPWCNTLLAFNPVQLRQDLLETVAPGVSAKSQMVSPHNEEAPLAERARSYLHINCSHCHRENAGGSVLTFMNVEMPMHRAGLLGKAPSQGTFGIPEAKVIAPGDPFRSVLYFRMATMGSGHMPLLGSKLVDRKGLDLLYRWINQTGGTNPKPAPAGIETTNLDSIVSSIPGALGVVRALDRNALQGELREAAIAKGYASNNPLVRDLFVRFVPEDKRIQTLGSGIDPQLVLSRQGDRQRGRAIFRSESAQCQSCHRLEGVGREFGPDLATLSRKYSRAQVLEHLLAPSRSVDPIFAAYTVELDDETVYTGFLVKKTESEVLLKVQTGETLGLPSAKIKRLDPQSLSLMPEGLLQSMTAQEAADLLEYLISQH